jgi:hypothetical protein
VDIAVDGAWALVTRDVRTGLRLLQAVRKENAGEKFDALAASQKLTGRFGAGLPDVSDGLSPSRKLPENLPYAPDCRIVVGVCVG